jgi:hypothetical protein
MDEFVALDSWQEREPLVASTNAYWSHYKQEKFWERPEFQDAVLAYIAEGSFEMPVFWGPNGPVSNPSPALVAGAHADRLIRPVLEHVEKTESADLSDSDVLSIHQAIITRWRSPRFHHHVIVPLTGLEAVGRELDLLGVMRVRALTVGDKTELAQAGGAFQPIRMTEIARCRVAAFADGACGLGESFDYKPLQNAIQCFITATRLLDLGRVGAEHLVCRRVWERPGVGASYRGFECTDTWNPSDAAITLSDAPNVERLTRQLDQVRGKPGYSRIAVAMRRFNLAFCRSFAEDSLVDLTIALENTVLADVVDELTYRLAVRAARLLIATDDPDFVFRLAKGMYTVRSKVVHGGQSLESAIMDDGVKPYWKAKAGAKQSHVFLRDCERLVSKLLTRFVNAVDAGKSVKDVLANVDDAIVGRPRGEADGEIEGSSI